MEKTQRKRGKSFTIDQDVSICKVWLNVTQDPIIDNTQSSTSFWDRIFENYIKDSNDHSRSRVSVQSRWGTIMRGCNKFHECLAQIEFRKQSGVSELDKILQAKLLFYELERKRFAFQHCWEILGGYIKGREVRSLKKSNTSSTTNNSDKCSSPFEVLEEPPISLDSNEDLEETDADTPTIKRKRKAEEETQRKSKNIAYSQSSRFCDLMLEFNKQAAKTEARKALAQERKLRLLEEANEREKRKVEIEIRLMQEKNKRKQKEKDDKIMLLDTSNMEPLVRVYFEKRKKEIYGNLMGHSN